MRFPTENMTEARAAKAAKCGDDSALNNSIEHWSYMAAYEPDGEANAYNCGLCNRYMRKTFSCSRCPLFKSGNGCNKDGSCFERWEQDKSQESALNMLNALLHIANREPITIEELP